MIYRGTPTHENAHLHGLIKQDGGIQKWQFEKCTTTSEAHGGMNHNKPCTPKTLTTRNQHIPKNRPIANTTPTSRNQTKNTFQKRKQTH